MPATPYFISAQIILIAISATMVKLDLKKKRASKAVVSIQQQEVPAAIPLDQLPAFTEETLLGSQVPRFALVEQNAAKDGNATEDLLARPMGFRDGEDQSQKSEFRPTTSAGISQPSRISAPAPEEYDPPNFDPVPLDSGYHIQADAATNFDLNDHTVVFSGHVSLNCPEFKLSADRLVVHMDAAGQSLKKLVANGDVDVHLTSVPKEESYRGQAEEALFDPAKSTITLMGWPKIQGHGREHIAATPTTRMTLHTVHPKLITEGRAQTRIVYQGNNGLPGVTMSSP